MSRLRAEAANTAYGIGFFFGAAWLCARVMSAVAVEAVRQRRDGR